MPQGSWLGWTILFFGNYFGLFIAPGLPLPESNTLFPRRKEFGPQVGEV
jgi:hypothetical protein